MATHPRDISTASLTLGKPWLTLVLPAPVGVAVAAPTLASIAANFTDHLGNIALNVADLVIGSADITMQPKWFIDSVVVGSPVINGSAVLASIGYNYAADGFTIGHPSSSAPAIAQSNKLLASSAAAHPAMSGCPTVNIIELVWLTPTPLTTEAPLLGEPDTYFTRPLGATYRLINTPSIDVPDITVNPGWFQTNFAIGSPQVSAAQLAIVGATPERLVITLLIMDSPTLAQTHYIKGASDVVPAHLLIGRPTVAPVIYAFAPQNIATASPTVDVPVHNQQANFIGSSIQITSIVFRATDIGQEFYDLLPGDLSTGSPDETAPVVLQPYIIEAVSLLVESL